MLTNLMQYKDFVAEIGYDDSADAFHGRVIGISDVIDFYGATPKELRKELKSSVDTYLDWCREEGTEPQKTWRGKMTFRPSDEQRRRFIVAAASRRLSVNAWAIEVLDRESQALAAQVPEIRKRSA